jgi:hypothetical protein
VNVHVNVPVAEVVCEVQVCVAGVTPLNVIVPIVLVGVNPVPWTVTVTPWGPWLGVRVIDGTVTVKAEEAVSPVTVPTSLPETTTL